jgi:uncharacterized protein
VKALIEAKANIDLVNEDGQSALIMAALIGLVEITEALLKAGADLDLVESEDGLTALLCAEREENNEVVELIK